MSLELIGTVAAVVLAAGVIFGGLWALLAYYLGKIDARFDKIDARFDKVDARFDKVDARFEKMETDFKAEIKTLDGKIELVREDLTAVKIAVAQLQGPAPRIIQPR